MTLIVWCFSCLQIVNNMKYNLGVVPATQEEAAAAVDLMEETGGIKHVLNVELGF